MPWRQEDEQSYSLNNTFKWLLIFLIFETQKFLTLELNITIKLHDNLVQYSLKGIIYHGNAHFTSCFISQNCNVWYHNGNGEYLANRIFHAGEK